MTVEAARSLLITHKEAHKAAIRDAIARNPRGKMARKFSVKMLDYSILEDKILEWGGDEGAILFITAQIAEGVFLADIAEHYCMDYGLLWAWVIAEKERYARYALAMQGIADRYIGEVVDISDEQAVCYTATGTAFDPDVPRDSLRIKTRLAVAAKYARGLYGDKEQTMQVAVGVTLVLSNADANV